MVDRRRRGTRRSSNSFHTCSALGFLVGMVQSRRRIGFWPRLRNGRKDPHAKTACGAPAVKPRPERRGTACLPQARDTRARLRSGELASPSVLAFVVFVATVYPEFADGPTACPACPELRGEPRRVAGAIKK